MKVRHRARAPSIVASMAISTLVLSAALGPFIAAPASAAAPSASAPAIDPAATESLGRMVEYLRNLPAFTVHAQSTREEVVNRDFKLQRNNESSATLKKPDRLRAFGTGDEGRRTFAYDGTTLALYIEPENYLATAAAPPSVREMLDEMLERYGVELPLLDVLYVAAGGDLASKIREAGYIGLSRIGGVECEHLAFRGAKADWQLWIERGDRPLPRKIVITTRDHPLAPEFSAVLRWDLAPPIDEAMFRLSPPASSMPIPFKELPTARPRPKKQR